MGSTGRGSRRRELFGHEKGAFTGADEGRPGLLKLASGGTLFLDEVGDMPPALQVKLLRALQEQSVRRVGGSEQIAVDLRVLSATHKDLRQMVEAEEFREDLFYRLAAIELRALPLRERGQDVVLLAAHFLDRLNGEHATSKRFGPRIEAQLTGYPWPGNVRELEHVLARAFLLADGAEIVDLQLPDLPQGDDAGESSGAPGAADPLTSRTGPVLPLKEVERLAIERALEATDGDKSKAARLLGISRTALYHKLKRHAESWGREHHRHPRAQHGQRGRLRRLGRLARPERRRGLRRQRRRLALHRGPRRGRTTQVVRAGLRRRRLGRASPSSTASSAPSCASAASSGSASGGAAEAAAAAGSRPSAQASRS